MKLYYGELDRFGYTLSAIDKNRDNLIKTIMDEYIRWYERRNDEDPRKELSDRSYAEEGETMYDIALNDLEEMIIEYHIGEVIAR